MARPQVVLCGLDGAHHFESLWAAGFSLQRCDSEYELVCWVARGKAPDLICVLEPVDRPVDEDSLRLLKRGTSGPLVLFQARGHANGHPCWDLAVPPGTPASDWLREVDALLER